MLKVDTSHPEGAYIEAQGDMVSIVADIGFVLSSVHDQFKRHDDESAKFFKFLVKSLVTDPETPVWDAQPGLQGFLITKPKNEEDK